VITLDISGFVSREDYTFRCTARVWKEVLLSNKDKIIVKGCVRQLTAKNMGVGVYEVSMLPMPKEPK